MKPTGPTRRALGVGGIVGLVGARAATAAVSPYDAEGQRAAALLAPFARPDRPGVSVAVARGRQRVFEWAGGCADLDHGVPLTRDTVFHIASLSKQFTAFAIALLERDGRLSLEAEIGRYLPDFPDLGAPITVGQLVHHTSGLRDQWNLWLLMGRDMEDLIRQDQMLSLARRQRGLNFPPGTDFAYSNTGYTLLAEIVERVAGRPFHRYLAEEVFSPAGMADTFVYHDAATSVRRRALSYDEGPDGQPQLRRLNYETWGATGVHSTVADLAAWGANLSDAWRDDREIIRRITTPGRLNDGRALGYGHGLMLGQRVGRDAIFHGGSDAGFRTNLAHFPDADLTVVVLANSPLDVGHIADQVADVFLPDPPRGPRPPVRLPPAPAPWPIASLVGSYAIADGELLTVAADRDGAVVRQAGGPAQRIIFRTDGTFDLGRPERTRYLVIHGSDGGVIRLEEVSPYGGPPIVFQRVAPAASPSAAALTAFVGRYRSTEIEVTYEVAVVGGRLQAQTFCGHPVAFDATLADRFDSGDEALATLQFERDAKSAVTAFTVNARRMRGMRFVRTSAE